MKREDYLKYRILGGDIYVLPIDIFDELFNELVNLQQENEVLKQKYNKALDLWQSNYPPCELDNFMVKNSEYCELNCNADNFKHCWDKFIEQHIKG